MLPYLNPVAHTFSMNSPLLFPLVLHSLRFSVPYFVHLTLTFIHTSPALSFPSTYCLCPPLHSLDVIVRIFHNFSPSPDHSNEKCIQKFPHFALPFKPFPTFHWRLRSALWPWHSLLPFQVKPGGAQSDASLQNTVVMALLTALLNCYFWAMEIFKQCSIPHVLRQII